jgi:hypothetical protein
MSLLFILSSSKVLRTRKFFRKSSNLDDHFDLVFLFMVMKGKLRAEKKEPKPYEDKHDSHIGVRRDRDHARDGQGA